MLINLPLKNGKEISLDTQPIIDYFNSTAGDDPQELAARTGAAAKKMFDDAADKKTALAAIQLSTIILSSCTVA
ncbi:MAG: hypothetical protein ACEQSL_03790 [Sediminibacterium sp.]